MSDGGRLRARPGERPARPGVPAGTAALRDGTLMHVPTAAAAGRPSPLIVLFHGAGMTARPGLDLMTPLAEESGLVLLAPRSVAATWDVIRGGYGPDVERLDAALADVLATCPIDPARIALAGFSDGASYALSLAVGNGDLVTHAIGFSPGFLAPPGAVGRPRVFVTHGRADRVLPIDRCSRRLVPALRDAGLDVTYEEFDGGHTVEPVHARAAVRWLTGAPPGGSAHG